MSSRDLILGKLREGRRPFPGSAPPVNYQPMVPLADMSHAELTARFVQEAEQLACEVHQVNDEEAALVAILGIVGADTAVSAWERGQIPLEGLGNALLNAGITVTEPDNPDVRVGITGADAALAATGSLAALSGDGRYRAPSLLPPRPYRYPAPKPNLAQHGKLAGTEAPERHPRRQ